MGNSQNSTATSLSNTNSLHHHHNHNHNSSNLKGDNNNMVISPPLFGSSSSPLVNNRCQHLQQNNQFTNNVNQTSSHSNSSNSNTSSSSASAKRKTKSKDSLLNNSFEANLANINFIDACSLIGNLNE
jgi:hypothetical protein